MRLPGGPNCSLNCLNAFSFPLSSHLGRPKALKEQTHSLRRGSFWLPRRLRPRHGGAMLRSLPCGGCLRVWLPSAEVEMDGSKDANPKLKRKNTEEASKPEGKGAGQDEMSLRNFRGVILAADLSGASCTWELQLFRLPSGQR